MTQDADKEKRKPKPKSKEDRLREALRANLQRRKVQARARKNGETDKD